MTENMTPLLLVLAAAFALMALITVGLLFFVRFLPLYRKTSPNGFPVDLRDKRNSE